ncbi:MAG: hypothetical protein GX130_06585 [Candidatus Hydrogenedens sp.]|jgi:hypothetical protein|nr:hypothetical protein [Candidatus Hydrogenedens sp.]
MKNMVPSILALSLLLGFSAALVADESGTLEKKLIEYGWDVPTPEYIRDNIRAMEEKPFDGVVFRLKGGGKVMDITPLTEEHYADDYDAAAAISWEKFTDNFVIAWAATEQDWFNDEHWEIIENNTALLARAAKLARCKGICFDPEPYGKNPWNYGETEHRDSRSYLEYAAQARKRGAQFMNAIQREFPSPQILSLYQFALFGEYCKPMSHETLVERLSKHSYALYPPFLNGMIDAAQEGSSLTDGDENAYYYTRSEKYYDAYHLMKQRARYLVDPALWKKFDSQVFAGSSLYVDQYFGMRADPVLGHKMTAEEQQKWFEHNVYHALRSTDRYVWCYSERMNWWTDETVPAGAEEAIRSARAKLEKGEALGFDLAPIVAAAEKRPFPDEKEEADVTQP